MLVTVGKRQGRIAHSLQPALISLSTQLGGPCTQILRALRGLVQPLVHQLGKPTVLLMQRGPGPNVHTPDCSPTPAAPASLLVHLGSDVRPR